MNIGTMPVSQADRTLRLITIWTWVPAMCLLIPLGIRAEYPTLSLGLIPMTISAILGLHLISSKSTHRIFTILMDVFIASFLFGLTVPALVYIRRGVGRGWVGPRESAMLGAFAAYPLMINLTLHVLFVLRETRLFALIGVLFSLPTCPHCNRDLRLFSSTHSHDSKDYVAVPREVAADDVEAGPSMAETPRSSVDDETARLL